MKKLALATAAAVLFTGAASAADLAPRYTKAPPLASAAYDWTGLYIGGNAGWVGERASGTSDFLDTILVGSELFSNPQSNKLSDSSFIGGIQGGYNWRVANPFVLGVEGDFDWMRTSYSFCRQTDISSANNCTDNNFGFESISGQTNWLATVRGRAGVTWANVFFYGTGGAAFGSVRTTESLTCLQEGCGASITRLAQSSTTTQIRAGWTAGLGIEAMITRDWSVKGEWLYVDLGSLTNTLATVGTGHLGGTGTQSAVWSRSEHYNIVRVGVNYHFNSPVVAKY